MALRRGGSTVRGTLTVLPCPCGGALRPHRFRNKEIDASALLGIAVVLDGEFMGNRCDGCGGTSLPGKLVEHLAERATLELLRLERRLSGGEARFVRKSALALGVDEIARLIGVPEETVTRWERSTSLTGAQDAALRDLAVGVLLPRNRLTGRFPREDLARIAAWSRRSVRSRRAPTRPPPIRVALAA